MELEHPILGTDIEPNRALQDFLDKLLIEQTQTLFFNIERTWTCLIELEHPIFGFEINNRTLNIVRPITIVAFMSW